MSTSTLSPASTIPRRLFFRGQYPYRRWGVVVFLVIGWPVSVGALVLLAVALAGLAGEPGEPKAWLVTLFLAVWNTVWVGITVWLTRVWVAGKVVTLEIDESGITCWGRRWGWDEVTWLAGQVLSKGQITLFFQTRHGVPFDRYLPSEPPLTGDEYAELMADLNREVLPRHPHLKLD